MLTDTEVQTMREAFAQTDAIFALEGFEPDETRYVINASILAGRVTQAQVIEEMRDYAMQHKTTEGFITSRTWSVKEDFFLISFQKENGRWYWQICQTNSGKVLENGHHGSATEQECRDEAAPFIGDWYAGYMSIEAPPAAKDTEEWMQRMAEGQRRMTADEGYRKAVSRRAF